jgi:hypothetical protein
MKALVFSFVAFLFVISMTNISVAQDNSGKKITMHRYLVERTFPNGLEIPVNMEGSQICLNVVSVNAEDKVSWVHSYVTMDHKKTFCIYDAPSPEAIRKSAEANGLPVDNIVEVSVLDPYFYR